MCFAIRMPKLGAFVEPRCTWVADLRTWPEDSIALVNAIPRDPVIIRHAAFGGDAQLFENVACRRVVELIAMSETRWQVRR